MPFQCCIHIIFSLKFIWYLYSDLVVKRKKEEDQALQGWRTFSFSHICDPHHSVLGNPLRAKSQLPQSFPYIVFSGQRDLSQSIIQKPWRFFPSIFYIEAFLIFFVFLNRRCKVGKKKKSMSFRNMKKTFEVRSCSSNVSALSSVKLENKVT